MIGLIFLLLDSFLCEASENEVKSRVKRAAENYRSGKVLRMDQHGWILVPQPLKPAPRRKREAFDNGTVSEEDGSRNKYKRLSHSVHIQSDIRYR